MVLNEANFLGVAVEALSAAHETILPDQHMGIPTHTAGMGARAVLLGWEFQTFECLMIGSCYFIRATG